MGAKLATGNQAALEIVAEACARNLPAELHIQQLDGNVVTCPLHDWRFDLTTG
ncbi:MAG: hypothetical protein IH988_07780, partial [Planctomycetes bacterium]|nr:hypothetical protein [Planctomycetota bacterium]